ncbi:hypothetical protein QR680_008069 [Steinernema hermaphroditum]|uniref:Globin domain-containing protein n=1 Tax=Steinernema hermaphroditum TaxID=289476 RepID=A0AA39IHE7_9BILA|nr:hypothetical protein QR680_008069 [Steinernema hermaphroditum]
MQKVWQWIRDKKSGSFRKWQSSNVFSTRRDSNNTFPSQNGGKKGLKPIGGSDDALTTRRDSSRRRKHHKSQRKVAVAEQTLFDMPTDDQVFDEFFDEVKPALEALHKQRRASIRSQHVITDYIDGDLPVTSAAVTSFNFPSPQSPPQSPPAFPNGRDSIDEVPAEPEPTASTSEDGPIVMKHIEETPESPREEAPMDQRPEAEEPKPEKVLRFNLPGVSVSFIDESRESHRSPPSLILNGRCRAASEPNSGDPAMNPDDATEAPSSNADSNGSVFEDALSGSPKENHEMGTPISTVIYESTLQPLCPSTPRMKDSAEKRRQSTAVQRRQSSNNQSPSTKRRQSSTKSTLIPLTSAQIHLVRTLWRQIYMSKGPTVIGSTIFHKFFFKCPKVKEQFRRCPLPRNFPNHDSFAKAHCKAMSELVDNVIENLENLDTMTADLERVGRIHAEVMNGEISTKIWNDLAETFIDCTLEWGDRRCRTETVRKAWALIIAFMIEKIKLGHSDQRKRMLSMRAAAANVEQLAVASLQIA